MKIYRISPREYLVCETRNRTTINNTVHIIKIKTARRGNDFRGITAALNAITFSGQTNYYNIFKDLLIISELEDYV